MDMPQDSFLLMSLVNTWLRDQYSSPEILCEDKAWNLSELRSRLESAGFVYQPEQNQYRLIRR